MRYVVIPGYIIDADRAIGLVDTSYDMELAAYEALMRSSHKIDACFTDFRAFPALCIKTENSRYRKKSA